MHLPSSGACLAVSFVSSAMAVGWGLVSRLLSGLVAQAPSGAESAAQATGSAALVIAATSLVTAVFAGVTALVKTWIEYKSKRLEEKLADSHERATDLQRQVSESHDRIAELERKSAEIPANVTRNAATDGKTDAAIEAALAPERGKLLLVEDDAGNAHYLAKNLSLRGYEVQHVATVKDAIADLEESIEPFVAVVLDLTLPDGDGSEVLDYCQAHGRRAKIVVVTGHADAERAAALHDKGAAAVLVKPLHAKEDLFAALDADAPPA